MDRTDPKPDNRADNSARNMEIAQNTKENLLESQEYLAERGDSLREEERRSIIEKNRRRMESIQAHMEEAMDELEAAGRGTEEPEVR
ncbi:MAG: small acid-soluble spore protein Tlp [Alicyclobacillaceae bacterium]|nr:small acid-soluble spore protein Tlp [Alicyclobacillaceae bacterium]